MYVSFPLILAFSNIRFTVWTVFSASPFPCGFQGLEEDCLNDHFLAKSLKSLDVYCGPLSLLTSYGIPWRANVDFMCIMTILLLVRVFKFSQFEEFGIMVQKNQVIFIVQSKQVRSNLLPRSIWNRCRSQQFFWIFVPKVCTCITFGYHLCNVNIYSHPINNSIELQETIEKTV